MQKTIKILNRALEDECVNIDLISLDKLQNIRTLLKDYPQARYFSEWRYEMTGAIKYR